MPNFQRGDMWSIYDRADLFLITTNSYIKTNGELAMGRGIAKQARDRFPGLALAVGKTIATTCSREGDYGLLVSPRWPDAKLGAFQVKRHYRSAAELGLIRHSTQMLLEWAVAHPSAEIHLNMPGIGFGRLQRDRVMTVVVELPARVTLWDYGR